MHKKIDVVLSILKENELHFGELKIRGLFVGGSVGRGESTLLSDLDLFLVVRHADLEIFHDCHRKQLFELFGRPLILRGPVWVDYFGYSSTCIYDSGFVIQLNVNSESTLRPNQYANSGALVLKDEDGVISRFLRESAGFTFNFRHEYRAWFDYLLIRMLFCIRETKRGESGAALSYMSQVREALFALAACKAECQWSVPQTPSKGFGKRMSSRSTDTILEIALAVNRENLTPSLKAILIWLDRELRSNSLNRADIQTDNWRSAVDLLGSELSS